LEAGSPEAIKVAVAESHAGAFKALVHRTERYGNRVESFNEDANKIVAAMLGLIPRRAPAFAFLHPEGSELEWPTVEAIAEHKRGHSPNKIEQLILFPTDMGFPMQNRRFPRDEGDAATRILPRRSPEVLRIAGTSSAKRLYINYESACSEGSVASS
jgi:three-Cys-motif partner protein